MVDGDEEALGVEAVHLDEPVVVRDGAVDDEEDEVVVVVDLGPLAELLGVLDRERVELEDVAEDLEVLVVRAVEVEPEEPLAGKQLLDGLPAELHLAAALVMEHVADRRPGSLDGGHASVAGRSVTGLVCRGLVVGHPTIVLRLPAATARPRP